MVSPESTESTVPGIYCQALVSKDAFIVASVTLSCFLRKAGTRLHLKITVF